MPKIIKDGAVVDDHWNLMAIPEDTSTSVGSIEENTLIPLSIWLTQKSSIGKRDNIGVWLNSDDAVESLADDLSKLSVIAINFPTFMDGRGFSSARLLRERYDYRGEIRAIGYVIRDQLCYLKRCGFNAFTLQPEVNLTDALSSLEDFTESYQTSVDQQNPLFRRRA